jgi:TIR domain
MKAYAFVSYQTEDKAIAGALKTILERLGIRAFLAHEDIVVSDEWRLKILAEVGKADIFVCLLSEHYFQSIWCVQESGIAAFRGDMTIMPLSLDGTIPQGFIGNYQSVRVDPNKITIRNLMPGLLKYNFEGGIELLIDIIGRSGSFRGAEENFQLILPYLDDMNDAQKVALLERAADNAEVHHASLCAKTYLPPLMASHGHLLKRNTRAHLKKVLAQYA